MQNPKNTKNRFLAFKNVFLEGLKRWEILTKNPQKGCFSKTRNPYRSMRTKKWPFFVSNGEPGAVRIFRKNTKKRQKTCFFVIFDDRIIGWGFDEKRGLFWSKCHHFWGQNHRPKEVRFLDQKATLFWAFLPLGETPKHPKWHEMGSKEPYLEVWKTRFYDFSLTLLSAVEKK